MCKVICYSEHDDANAFIYLNQLELFFDGLFQDDSAVPG